MMFHLLTNSSGECHSGDRVLMSTCSLLISRRVSVVTPSTMEYGLIPREFWSQPDWIDEEKAMSARNRMAAANVKYGGMYFSSHSARSYCNQSLCTDSISYV